MIFQISCTSPQNVKFDYSRFNKEIFLTLSDSSTEIPKHVVTFTNPHKIEQIVKEQRAIRGVTGAFAEQVIDDLANRVHVLS